MDIMFCASFLEVIWKTKTYIVKTLLEMLQELECYRKTKV